LRLLSLDGGGIRGISSLIILDAIMHKINERRDPKILPCQYFQLAGGTSTGGLIALLLFWLEMDTRNAIMVYQEMAKNIFSPRLPKLLGGYNLHDLGYFGYCIGNPYLWFKALLLPSRFSDSYLREAIDVVMMGGGQNLRKPGPGPPRMFMCATSITHERAELFRSYEPPQGVEDRFQGITVRDAALATSAAPTYLPKVKIGNEEFWDGGLLNNNPINQVWDARYDAAPNTAGEPDIYCVVSIGTGRVKGPVQQPGGGFINTVSTAISYTTNTEAKHQDFKRMIDRRRRGGVDIHYFRFDVELEKEINLDDWQSMSTLEKIT
ncbi:acyl transferase/acyl hydrolase/lysophospholipase, partial [Ilyonectria robusta]|uniref:acyl transferase/acyl hydrolase/lysophospholipase n=1 Tax=Ilyonectria robusta TaxID=1079257 RepID=UPI001E8E6086